eukprot:scaffold12080_cov39-Cylindrotheca_fusiformis.AAC.1
MNLEAIICANDSTREPFVSPAMPAMTSSCQSGFARGTRVKRVAGAALVHTHIQVMDHTNATTAFRLQDFW